MSIYAMCTSCSSLGVVLLPPWRLKKPSGFSFVLPNSKKRSTASFAPLLLSSSHVDDTDNSIPEPRRSQLGFDPSEELLGLEVDLPSRNAISGAPRPRSWFGPNGQYIRELPCPICRGRGYTSCMECGIERSRLDCSQCSGKGIVTCKRCLGECVIWEESIDEQPWEKARSTSPFKVKEDDDVDNLDIKLDAKTNSKRVYRSTSPEVGMKISRSLKSLNAKTGLFTKRMKIIHRDPVLHAQRVASIKRAKGTPAARKHASETQKAFFSNPENRQKRSIAMIGIKFYCSHCGCEGHRRHYCPVLKDSLIDRRFRCRVCGEKGHNRRTCRKSWPKYTRDTASRLHCCRICGVAGHNRRTCPQRNEGESLGGVEKRYGPVTVKRVYTCGLCQKARHNSRTCPTKNFKSLRS